MHESSEQMWRLDQVAQYLNVKPGRVRDLVRRGEIRVHRVGRLLRFKPRDLETFISRSATDDK